MTYFGRLRIIVIGAGARWGGGISESLLAVETQKVHCDHQRENAGFHAL